MKEEGPFHKTSKNDEKIPILCHYLIMIFVPEFLKNLKNASARSTILICCKKLLFTNFS